MRAVRDSSGRAFARLPLVAGILGLSLLLPSAALADEGESPATSQSSDVEETSSVSLTEGETPRAADPAATCALVEGLSEGDSRAVENGTVTLQPGGVLRFQSAEGTTVSRGNGWFKPSPNSDSELHFNLAPLECNGTEEPEPDDPPEPSDPVIDEVTLTAPTYTEHTVTFDTAGGRVVWDAIHYDGETQSGQATHSRPYRLSEGETVCVTPSAADDVEITNLRALTNLCFTREMASSPSSPSGTPSQTSGPSSTGSSPSGGTGVPAGSTSPVAGSQGVQDGMETSLPSVSEGDPDEAADDMPDAGASVVLPAIVAGALLIAGVAVLLWLRRRMR